MMILKQVMERGINIENYIEALENLGKEDIHLVLLGTLRVRKYLSGINYSVPATLKADGTVEKTIIGSIVESVTADRSYP